MNLADNATQYARQHPQEVTLACVNRSVRTYSAGKAVQLCGTPDVAACIVGAAAQDRRLEDMLNQLIDLS